MNTLNLKKTTLTLICLTGFALNAHAFDTDEVQESQTAYGEQFTKLDKNDDGVLTKVELKKDDSYKNMHFAKADKDHDGTLDKSEYGEEKARISKNKVERVASDSWITTKAKAQLLNEESLKSLKISVETHKGIVLLSGFVSSPALKAKAGEIVSKIEGVKVVKNGIVINS
jgi:hyperosmotically inducible periplasmic protein